MSIDEGTLLAVERQDFILNLLLRDGVVRNNTLKELLGVSLATIRADLRELESAGACEIVWGGAVAKNRSHASRDLPVVYPVEDAHDAKRRIGKRAAQLLESGQTILVDAGSTTVELVHHLPDDLHDLRLITPGLNIAVAAAQYPQVEVILTGGILRHLTRSLIGSQVQSTLDRVNADWAFIATGGFGVEHGVTTSNVLEADVKRLLEARAAKAVILADSSKFGRVLSLCVVPLSQIDILISDVGLSDEAAEAIGACGVEVLRV
jgi:DeoR family transcriptional regulator of aga operon